MTKIPRYRVKKNVKSVLNTSASKQKKNQNSRRGNKLSNPRAPDALSATISPRCGAGIRVSRIRHRHTTKCGVMETHRVVRLVVADKSLGDTASDVISDSSGVGTSQSDTTNASITIPGTTVVCVESYSSGIPGHLAINQGDILEGQWELCFTGLGLCSSGIYGSECSRPFSKWA